MNRKSFNAIMGNKFRTRTKLISKLMPTKLAAAAGSKNRKRKRRNFMK